MKRLLSSSPDTQKIKPDPRLNRAQRRAIRFKQVCEIVPLRRSRIYQLIANGQFPAGFKLTPGGHASAWWEEEIYCWLESRAADSNGGAE